MKVTVLTCFESNEERASYILDACSKAGYDVEVLTTDFSHIRKSRRDNVPDGFLPIETIPYKKNLSFERIYSHFRFAKDAFDHINRNKPDVLWVIAPANSLIKQAKIFKAENQDTKIIIDIIDMWPESLPFNFNKHIFPFSIWRNIRKNNLDCADVLVSECNFYKDILNKEYAGDIKTLYLSRSSNVKKRKIKVDDKTLSLCYIGSINNIIDTDKICRIIKMIDEPVEMHVIGEGENTDSFIDSLKKVCNVTFWGAVRDEKQKSKIFDRCHAGINIYKDGLYIGLTTKCIDYFENGLPIINNIKGDTWDMVENYKVGFNIDKDCILKSEDIISARKNNGNIYELYDSNFTKKVFTKNCLSIIEEVIR